MGTNCCSGNPPTQPVEQKIMSVAQLNSMLNQSNTDPKSLTMIVMGNNAVGKTKLIE